LGCHSVAAVLTLVKTKQIRINIHKRNNTKTQYKKIPNAYYRNNHILQNNLKQLQYKLKQTQYKIYPNEIVTM